MSKYNGGIRSKFCIIDGEAELMEVCKCNDCLFDSLDYLCEAFMFVFRFFL